MENPKIRFKGFTKDWEQRKLIDYLEVSSEKNRDNRFTKEDVLSVSGEYGIVNQIEFQGRSFAGASVSNYGVVENGDVVYTKSPLKSNPYGIIKTNKGIPGIVSTLYAVYKPKEITDSKFVQIYFELDSRMNSYMHPLVNKGAKNDMKVSAENALKGMVSFPKKDEQEMISLYFSTLDHLITLHQRKCEQTKKLKKYMLQKMFPQNGAKVPEIRFDGFTYDWEQRKLGDDLVSIHTGTNLLGSITNTGMPLIKMGNIQRGYFDTSKVEFLAENEQPDKADIANYGDFFFNTRNTLELVGKGATWMKNSGEYAFNSNIARFELRNLDTIFFNYLYNTDYMTKQIHARAMGTTSVAAIYPRTLDSVEYLAPCMKEQQKIGAYFKQLDHLITLHQRKCDELKKMKKYMLQNMFI
jgi:type I restriction enzyme S subunit